VAVKRTSTSTSKTKKTVKKEPAELVASRELAQELARVAEDRHCRDIVILEVAGISPVAMHFVIATGTSDQQTRSVAREMEEAGQERKYRVYGRAGMQQGRWVVLDFVDVVVHLFDEEFRNFYDLELLWGDAPRIEWQRE
jgi:ribosome-associated protein